MSRAQAARVEVASSETQFESLLSQIRVQVSWACRCYYRFTNPSVIDDLAQEIAFLLIKNDGHNLKSFEHRAKEKTWLRVVALHHVARYFKGQKTAESIENLPDDLHPWQLPSQDEELLFKELKGLVEKSQGDFTGQEQELLNHLSNGLEDREIAMRMGIEIRTVQRYKCALRKKIKNMVRRLAGEELIQ